MGANESEEVDGSSQYPETEYEMEHFETPQNGSQSNFLDTLVKEVPYEYRLKKYKVRRTPVQQIAYEMDDIYRFRNTITVGKSTRNTIMSLSATRSTTMRNFVKKRQRDAERERLYNELAPSPRQNDVRYPVEVVSWEELAWREFEGCPVQQAQKTSQSSAAKEITKFKRGARDSFSSEESLFCEAPDENAKTNDSAKSLLSPSNPLSKVAIQELVNDRLLQAWEEEVFCDAVPKLQNRLTLYIDDPNIIFEKIDEKRKNKAKKKTIVERTDRNRYNISNDKYYNSELKKISLGTFGVQHSLLALRLDNRFYRVNYTRDELKNFHKPALALPNREYSFYTVRVSLDPKNQGSSHPVIKKPNDLSLARPVQYVILEYSEEHPFFIMNVGMASLLNKYYRKNETEDDNRISDCIILDGEEEAPFFGFGDVTPGTHQHAITNNLFTAPLFLHRTTDFLCIYTGDKICVRPIGAIYLVGQEFPKEEIFAPHSRRLNQFSKDFLRAATYKIFSKGKDLLMSDLDEMLPYFSEGSKRKWLKEYADCVKKGRDNVWISKGAESRFGEESLRRLVTPENVCQYESMLATEIRMQDQGYRFVDVEEDGCGKYSPGWALTRNFLNATSGRGLLELTYDGSTQAEEPQDTGMIDEIFFSFKRVKLKKGSEAENRRILNEHQSSYKGRIDRIWKKQIETLSSIESPALVPKRQSVESETVSAGKVLTIKRVYSENGTNVTRIEHINDPRVAKAYLKARKKNVSEKKGILRCSNCGQTGHMKTNKTCPNYMGVARGRTDADKRRAKTYLQDSMNKLLSKFMTVPFSNAFHRPVSAKKFPDYPRIVKNPIDFSAIRTKIRNFSYKTFAEFKADFKLMLDNCALYNGSTHSLTDIAAGIYDDVCTYEADNSEQLLNAESLITGDE